MSTAGWYNDPTDPTLARWHDGTGWTDHVVDKAEWEAIGHEPPPPIERWVSPDPSRDGRLRVAVGAAAVVGALLVAGVALAQGGGDDDPDLTPVERQTDVADRVGDGAGGLTDLGGDPATSVGVTGEVDPPTGSSGSTARSGSPRSTPTTRASGGVQRTETRIETHENQGPIESQIDGEDKSSVGNTSNKTIHDGYVPPPTTTTPPTTATTAPPETTTTATTASPEPPVG